MKNRWTYRWWTCNSEAERTRKFVILLSLNINNGSTSYTVLCLNDVNCYYKNVVHSHSESIKIASLTCALLFNLNKSSANINIYIYKFTNFVWNEQRRREKKQTNQHLSSSSLSCKCTCTPCARYRSFFLSTNSDDTVYRSSCAHVLRRKTKISTKIDFFSLLAAAAI